MLKRRVIALVTGIALLIAVGGASAVVAKSLVASATAGGQAIACSASSGSGGGC